jgi:hypothetical protein
VRGMTQTDHVLAALKDATAGGFGLVSDSSSYVSHRGSYLLDQLTPQLFERLSTFPRVFRKVPSYFK